MSERVNYILSFVGGIAVGVFASYHLASLKAEERADLEIEEMRKYFLSKQEEAAKATAVNNDAANKAKESHNKPDPATVAKAAKTVNYTMYSTDADPSDPVISSEPVVIRDDNEWLEDETYSTVYLTYYRDNILSEDMSSYVYDKNTAEDAVGAEALKEFSRLGPNGDPIDVVHVRNDRLRTYYEITRSYMDFDESRKSTAVGMEDDGEYY